VRDQLTRGGRTADGETLEEGAAREAREEPRTDITVYGILGAHTTCPAFEWLAPSPARSSP
jgi:ADP-ribose pyrophosphatase YjhB (NUDIX family)